VKKRNAAARGSRPVGTGGGRGQRAPAAPDRTRHAVASVATESTQKLQKVLAQAGLGSRRDMEQLIGSGGVTVNGATARIGARVGPHDQIKVAGRVIHAKSATRRPRVLLYHKPEGEITSRDDPRGRPSVFEHLPVTAGAKWISVGRLDFNTCGLLIFTTSGELANRMMHPRFEIEREYAVRVMGQLQPDHVRRLTQGIELEDGVARCLSVELRGGEGANQWCHVVLQEGRNRIVRRMFEKLGFTVSRLMRVRFGIIELPPRLKRGQTQELSADEIQRLLDWLDAAPPAPPGQPHQAGRRARA
jgi:23S rRNA pseudouridine2605 synthase